MANTQLLKKLYLFKDLADSEMKVVSATAEIKTYQTGDEVFSAGDSAKYLYVVQRGSVQITVASDKGDTVEIVRLGAGSHFGEMSFLDGEVRSASARAMEATEVVAVDYDKLSAVMVDNQGIASHFYRQFALFLCGRLRQTTKELTFSRSKTLSHF
jgi:CRP-like cAMP-binding protein